MIIELLLEMYHIIGILPMEYYKRVTYNTSYPTVQSYLLWYTIVFFFK